MAYRDDIDAIDSRVDRKMPQFPRGKIQSAQGGIAQVLVNNNTLVEAVYDEEMPVSVGKMAILMRLPTEQGYVILSTYRSRKRAPFGPSQSNQFNHVQLAPPSNVMAFGIPGGVVIKWDAPVQAVVAFEVYTNSSPTEVGETLALTTRGSYAIIDTTTTIHARVRSVNAQAARSGYSAWVNATPEASQIAIYDEGILRGLVNTINFLGAAVSASVTGATGVVSVTGANASGYNQIAHDTTLSSTLLSARTTLAARLNLRAIDDPVGSRTIFDLLLQNEIGNFVVPADTTVLLRSGILINGTVTIEQGGQVIFV